MREWMRERMRRRSKRGPNTSESTGKIGQEIPVNQPAPLRPSYTEGPPSGEAHGDEENEPLEVAAEPFGVFADAGEEPEDAADPETAETEPTGKLVVETQPESPSIPPPEPQAAGQRNPRGFVVLAIGLPGSG